MRSLLVLACLLLACGTPSGGTDGGAQDSGTTTDAGGGGGGGGGAGGGAGGGSGGGGGAAVSSPVRINEVYVDRNLSGDRVEYVELSGPVGEPLGGLFLRILGPTGTVRYDLAVSSNDAGVIGATGTWVVGGILASGRVDQQYNISTWGLDNTSGAVQLVKREAAVELLDVLGYGAAVPAPTTPPSATSEGSFVTLPADAGTSLGRRAGIIDTDNNPADFCVQTSSCGAANGSCL